MSLIKEVDSFVERAYPGATLTKDYSFVSIPSVHMRIVAVGKEQFLADELCSEKCWLVTIGLEPTSAFPTARSETREFHRQTDGRSESVRQLMFELGGRVDIATVRSEFGQDVLLVIAPGSGQLLDVSKRHFHAATADALAMTVAAHPHCFE